MNQAEITTMIRDALAARSSGATVRELSKFLGLSEANLTLRLRELEKENVVEAFGQEFHSGSEEPVPVWRLKT